MGMAPRTGAPSTRSTSSADFTVSSSCSARKAPATPTMSPSIPPNRVFICRRGLTGAAGAFAGSTTRMTLPMEVSAMRACSYRSESSR